MSRRRRRSPGGSRRSPWPRRLAVAAAGVTVATAGVAYTAATGMPGTTAGYYTTQVSGATLLGRSYTVVAGTITGATLKFKGNQTGRTVTAAFGTAPAVTCAAAPYDLLTNTTTAVCAGFAQGAGTSVTFQVTVS